MSALVVPDDTARAHLIHPDDDAVEAADEPNATAARETVKCDHCVAAIRRTFVNGSCKGRSFYSCGTRSKAHRCNFFVWSDEGELRFENCQIPGQVINPVHAGALAPPAFAQVSDG